MFPCLQWRRAPLGNVRDARRSASSGSGSEERERAAAAARAADDRLAEAGRCAGGVPVLPRARAAAHRRSAPAGRGPRRAGRSRRARSTRLRVRFGAGGLGFSAGPDHALLPERARGDRAARAEPHAQRPPFEIELVDVPPWTSDDEALFPVREPAVQRWQGERLLASHRSFTAEIDPFARHARLQRREERAYPLETVIRTSLMARLPLDGGLPLHAAGVVLDGQAIAFFGPSGAGKSTLAATSPFPCFRTSSSRSRRCGRSRSRARGSGERAGRAGARPRPRSRLLVDLAEGTRARARTAAAGRRRGPHSLVRPRASRAGPLGTRARDRRRARRDHARGPDGVDSRRSSVGCASRSRQVAVSRAFFPY